MVTGAEMKSMSRRRALDRASWGALFAGFFVGMGVLFMLVSLGAAVGFTSVDPRDLGSWKTMGLGLGIWGGISAIVSSFCGAWVAARLSSAPDRSGGMWHGVALWGFTWGVALWLGAMLVGGAVSGAAKAAGGAAQAAGSGAAKSGASVSALTDPLADQLNGWLRDQGKPAVPKAQMNAALSDIGNRAMTRVRQGASPKDALDHQMVVSALARNTNLSRADAESLARQVESQGRDTLTQAQEKAGDAGEAAASGAKKGAWGAFLASLFTLAASAFGGTVGVPQWRTRRVEGERDVRLPDRPLAPQRT